MTYDEKTCSRIDPELPDQPEVQGARDPFCNLFYYSLDKRRFIVYTLGRETFTWRFTLNTTESIESFLKSVPINFAQDLTSRCTGDMECQVMVDPTNGEAVYDGDKLIRNTWSVTSDDLGTYNYHHIRIPRNAMSEPYYNDTPLRFPLMRHVECIGMTGWNWKKKRSFWLGFDFDAITGHAVGVGVDDQALGFVQEAAAQIPWVQVRRSTGGAGLHLYVYFDPQNAPEVANHNVHAALARTVLGLMEREAGFDFRGNMDVLGGCMWIWHRKINNENKGLEILKDYEDFCPELPTNWLDNLNVVTGSASKINFQGVSSGDYESFEDQASARVKVELDDTHKEIETRIHELGYSIVWIPDYHCWQTHTKVFEKLLEEYPGEYQGIFKTLSDGSDPGKPNCFVFPTKNGGLRITRFGRGAKEHDTWNQIDNDWTWTYFNHTSSLMEAASIYGGVEDPDGKGWVFTDFSDVDAVCRSLGTDLPLDQSWLDIFGEIENRNITLRPNKNQQLVLEIDKKKDDQVPKGWIEKKGKFTRLQRTTTTEATQNDETTYDDRVRALVDVNNEFSQWVLRNDDGVWVGHNKDNTRSALRIHAPDQVEEILGSLIIKNWKLVNVPFQPEYMGERKWNRHAPQFAVTPGERTGEHPTWEKVLDHCGQDLDIPLKSNTWCREAGIHNGADYLRYWLAFMFRDPYCKLPYLFMYGPQNSGKTTFHEAAALLMTRGVCYADEALKSKSNFNGELAGSVLCVVEETDLSSAGSLAYDRMKSWVTGEYILVHAKYQQPFQLKNSSHWVHTSNYKTYVYIDPGDTRVVMMYVPMLDGAEIPRDTLFGRLKNEAPAFLRTLLDLKLPSPPGRLRLPILSTDSKKEAEESVESMVVKFIQDECHAIEGSFIKLKDFYTSFRKWLPESAVYDWSYNKVCDQLRQRDLVPFGRYESNVMCLGNISLEPIEQDKNYGQPLVRYRQKLVRVREQE